MPHAPRGSFGQKDEIVDALTQALEYCDCEDPYVLDGDTRIKDEELEVDRGRAQGWKILLKSL